MRKPQTDQERTAVANTSAAAKKWRELRNLLTAAEREWAAALQSEANVAGSTGVLQRNAA